MMDTNQTELVRGEGRRRFVFALLAAILLLAVLVAAAAVVVLALTIADGFPHEEVLWMYIDFPEPITLTA